MNFYDILIALYVENVEEECEINWSIYDIKQQNIIDEKRLKDFITFYDEINNQIFEIVNQNKRFCFVIFQDSQFQIIQQIAQNIQLNQYFLQYFDIKKEFQLFFKQQLEIENIQDILTILNLKEIPTLSQCQSNCKSIVRLINIFIRNQYEFINPQILDFNYQLIYDKQYNYKYIRLRGLPYNIQEQDIIEFLNQLIMKNDLIFKYQENGKFSGECIVKVSKLKDFQDIMSMNLCRLGHRYIEMIESNQFDFDNAKQQNKINTNEEDPFYQQIIQNDYGILRARGLPYETQDEQIQQFFNGYEIIGIKIMSKQGKLSGQAFIIFKSQNESKKALSQNKQKIQQRYIELFISNPKELINELNQDSIYRYTLKSIGWHYDTTKQDVLEFFQSFQLSNDNINFCFTNDNRFNGQIYINFETEIEAQRAIYTKNMHYCKDRFIQLIASDNIVGIGNSHI